MNDSEFTFSNIFPPLAMSVSNVVVNDQGEVAGTYLDATGASHGFTYSNGVYINFDALDGLGTTVTAINNSGELTGYFEYLGTEVDNNSSLEGFYGDPGSIQALPPGFFGVRPSSINDSGQIVANEGEGIAVFNTTPGSNYNFQLYESSLSAISINNAGDIIGNAYYYSGEKGFAAASDGTTQIIAFPGSVSTPILSDSTSVSAESQTGEIVGRVIMSYVDYGFSDVSGVYSLLSVGYNPTSINSAGDIAGTVSGDAPNGTGDVGFIDNDGNIQTIAVPGAISTDVTGLNDSNEVVGIYEDASGVYYAFSATQVPACYCPGTLVLTARGERPVEKMRIGDSVITASGECRPIVWIGHRSYAGRFLAANPAVQPIRFRSGSLGGGLPQRDLLVSPEHAMFLDGLLIPARCLVNGSTIIQERGLERVDYLHVELDTHDVVLAEGAASESYLDDDSRGVFHNASAFAALYPDAPPPAGFCAPRMESGFELEAIRARLVMVAGEIKTAA